MERKLLKKQKNEGKKKDLRDMVIEELNLKKMKKNKKIQKFAYDMHCKDIVNGKD